MTADIRFINCWRYYGIHREHALSAGQGFALVPSAEPRDHAIPEDLAHLANEAGLEVASLTGSATASWNVFRTGDGLTIFGHGAHEIIMRNHAADGSARPERHVSFGHTRTHPFPVFHGGQELVIGRDSSMWASIKLGAGAEVRLRTEEFSGQHTTIVWTLSSKHNLSQ